MVGEQHAKQNQATGTYARTFVCSLMSSMTRVGWPNTRMQLTTFGARDRCYFGVFSCSAPRRQLMRNPLGGFPTPSEKAADGGQPIRPTRVACPARRGLLG